MRNDILKKFICILTIVSLFMMSACSHEEPVPEGADKYLVYYINNEETRTGNYEIYLTTKDPDEIVAALLDALAKKSEKAQFKAPLSMGFTVLDYTFEDGRLSLNMSSEYKNLVFTTEVLVRAAIVRTLCGSGLVDTVDFTVEGKPLKDHSGFEVGDMNASTFISNDGNEINTYEEADIRLYFASADGNYLISVYRNKFYSTSMPLERFVVDELIAGPAGRPSGLYPSVNPSTSVLSISTKDGVCYVNLSSDFLIPAGNVPTSVSVHAIANSLVDLPGVDKVQILVDGAVPELLESSYELDTGMVIGIEEALEIEGSGEVSGK